MSSSQLRRELERKRAQRTSAEGDAAKARSKEAAKRAEATKARASAAKAKSAATRRSRNAKADRAEKAADDAGKKVAKYQTRAADFAKQEAKIAAKLSAAELRAAADADRRREASVRREQASLESRMSSIETHLFDIRPPKAEVLRVLFLGAASEGDLRIDREIKRIENAVRASTHRDLVEVHPIMAATQSDVLDGLARIRPHVVHFSGHSNEDFLLFDRDVDERNEGESLSAELFARAIGAVDDPPILVVLNSCKSAAQLDGLVETAVPFAIGMSDSIGNGDAIGFASRFYACLAEGQSIIASYELATIDMEMLGLPDADLPTMQTASNADPGQARLVVPPPE